LYLGSSDENISLQEDEAELVMGVGTRYVSLFLAHEKGIGHNGHY